MKLSKFGKKLSTNTGILQLMDDLGSAVSSEQKVIMLGGGNPSHIPQVQAHLRQRMAAILAEGNAFEQLIGNYGPPQGDKAFTTALAALFCAEYGWDINPDNIALTNGSQTSFFYLFNLLAGKFEDGTHKKILLPMAPEYIGYLDVGLEDDFFVAGKPEFEFIDRHTFKYHVDFDALFVTDQIGAICVSRPTNPTGNVLTDDEIKKLGKLAEQHDVPLIIDNAYGLPFPSIIFTDARPVCNQNIVMCMSLSKLGLPGPRTGIVIARPEIAAAISALNAVISLAPGSFGAALTRGLVESGEIIKISHDLIQPYYRQKSQMAVNEFRQALGDVDYYIHKPEGAFFLWLWFKGLPITSQQLYERLKMRGVIIVPGEYFFPGLQEAWQHKTECIRVSYAGKEEIVKEGVKIIAEEVKRACDS